MWRRVLRACRGVDPYTGKTFHHTFLLHFRWLCHYFHASKSEALNLKWAEQSWSELKHWGRDRERGRRWHGSIKEQWGEKEKRNARTHRGGEGEKWHHISQPLFLSLPPSPWHLCSTSCRGGAHTASRSPPSLLIKKRGWTTEKRTGKSKTIIWHDEQHFRKHGVDRRLRPAQRIYSGHQSWNHSVLQVREWVSFNLVSV